MNKYKDKDIKTYNTKGEPHGYWEIYKYNGELYFKCVYVKGEEHGFAEYYWDEKVIRKNYHL